MQLARSASLYGRHIWSAVACIVTSQDRPVGMTGCMLTERVMHLTPFRDFPVGGSSGQQTIY